MHFLGQPQSIYRNVGTFPTLIFLGKNIHFLEHQAGEMNPQLVHRQNQSPVVTDDLCQE